MTSDNENQVHIYPGNFYRCIDSNEIDDLDKYFFKQHNEFLSSLLKEQAELLKEFESGDTV
ncbi:MAG: hypothetical protein IJ642_00595 [Oscillospiraceae bacterium]|nr:hypothetical protein [Oscillospiraceae bacterium]